MYRIMKYRTAISRSLIYYYAFIRKTLKRQQKMINKVPVIASLILPVMMLAAAGCSKENSGSAGEKATAQSETIKNHAAEARKLIEAKREKAKSDCGTYLTARAGSGRVRYTDEKGPDKKGEITVVGTLDATADKEQLSFKCTVKANDGPLYDLVNLELYKIEPTEASTAKEQNK